MITSQDHRLTCRAVAWTHDGPQLQTDEQHAFRYEVRDADGVVAFITADRARQHPDVQWELTQDGKVLGTYATVKEAFEALAAF